MDQPRWLPPNRIKVREASLRLLQGSERALRRECETECLSTITILKAALLLEKKHREGPYYETAVTPSLNYLVLALTKKEKGRAVLRDQYISEALMWKR